jgi:hypothetical protein
MANTVLIFFADSQNSTKKGIGREETTSHNVKYYCEAMVLHCCIRMTAMQRGRNFINEIVLSKIVSASFVQQFFKPYSTSVNREWEKEEVVGGICNSKSDMNSKVEVKGRGG